MGRWLGWTSAAANPLDVLAGELLDLLSDLGDKCVGVVAGGVSFKPDLPACVLTREDHLAAAEHQPQVTGAVNAHGTVAAGFEDIQEAALGDGRPAAGAGGRSYQVFGHPEIMPLTRPRLCSASIPERR